MRRPAVTAPGVFLALAFGLPSVGPTNATTVCSNGCDYSSIQAAVDAAGDYFSIELGAETFLESVVILGKRGSIRGAGARATVIDGGSSVTTHDAVIYVDAGDDGGVFGSTVVLSDMTIRNGVTGVVLAGHGVSLVRVIITGNLGAGVVDSTIDILERQSAIVNSTISWNLGDGVQGPGPTYILNSTISENGGSGLFYVQRCSCGMSSPWPYVSRSTIAGNRRGIMVTGSSCPSFPCDLLPPGDPIYWTPSELGFSSSIVATNLESDCTFSGYRVLVSSGSNLDGDGTCPHHPTDLQMADPLLLPLADNGGPTPTRALAPGSPAIDYLGANCFPPTDQRGVTRPQDGDGDGIALCDIGAFELEMLSIQIDVRPDSFVNPINPHNRGIIPVAIFGSESFNVTDIDVTTLRLGPNGAGIVHNLNDSFTYDNHVQDLNMDGFVDLITHYRTWDTGISCGDESATLTGETLDGQFLAGTDFIRTVGCVSRRGTGRQRWRSADEPE